MCILLQGMPGMAFMMDAYEQELKRPIRNVVNGQLPRTLLIQARTYHRFRPAANESVQALLEGCGDNEPSEQALPHLPQLVTCAMQVQKLKLDTESAMLEMDQVRLRSVRRCSCPILCSPLSCGHVALLPCWCCTATMG